MAIVYPSLYGGAPPMSTRIIPQWGVLTSFVPSVHNQGASVAPLQGLALRNKFLPATGSFFVVACLAVCVVHQHLTADVFLMFIPYCLSLTGIGLPDRDRNQMPDFQTPGSCHEQACFMFRLLCRFWSSDISQHLLSVIVVISCCKQVEHP